MKGHIMTRTRNSASGATLLNRALPDAMPADGWCHMAPFGKYAASFEPPNGGKPYRAIQICDRQAFEAMLANFSALKNRADFRGLLLDEDHLSESPTGRTAAMGRIMDLQIRGTGASDADGMWCRIDFTPPGSDAVRNKVYSYLSLDALVEDCGVDAETGLPCGRPVNLQACALTNKPRLPVRAMNRDTISATDASASGGKKTDPAKAGEKGNMDPKKILCALLGLDPATATDQEIQAAADAMKTTVQDAAQLRTQCSTLQTENAELKLGTKADAFLEKHKTKIKNSVSVRAAYLKDPTGTEALFDGLADAAPGQQPRTLNGGGTPSGGTKVKNRRAEQNAAVRAYMAKHNIEDYGIAQQQVAAAEPELFQAE